MARSKPKTKLLDQIQVEFGLKKVEFDRIRLWKSNSTIELSVFCNSKFRNSSEFVRAYQTLPKEGKFFS